MRLIMPREKSAISFSASSARSSTRSNSSDRNATTTGSMLRSMPAYSSISAAVSRSKSTGLSGTKPTRDFASRGFGQTGTPSMVAVPASGRSRPLSMRSVVDFPAPLGPAMP